MKISVVTPVYSEDESLNHKPNIINVDNENNEINSSEKEGMYLWYVEK